MSLFAPDRLRASVVVMVALACALAAKAGAQGRPPAEVAGAGRPAARYEVTRASSRVVIDGQLNDAAWATAVVIPLPFEYQPGDNAVPPVKTECLVTYDDHDLYVAYRAHDPDPHSIRSHLMARDDINTFVQDDHVGFLLDAFNDERRAYQFRVNPAGVQADALNSEVDDSEDWSWDAIWSSAARIDADGYIVEIAIPLNQIRFPSATEALTFGFEAFRSYPRSVRHRIASHPTDRNRSCGLCQVNKLTGFEGITPGRAVELDPTLTLRRSDTRAETVGAPMTAGPIERKPGVTVRWSLTPGITLNGAANPDFSQVEADVAQLDVNTRFVLFFPEKRPFFLEGIDFFATPEQAVFTRTVADPQAGVKVTGKSGRNGFGVFVTRDRINNLVLPSNQESRFAFLDDEVTGAVLRYRRDLGRGSTIGAIYSGREGTGYHNRLAGPDAFLRLSAVDVVRVQFLYSGTEYPESLVRAGTVDARTVTGSDAYAQYQHFARNWQWQVSYNDRSPAFRADAGFIPRVDTRTFDGLLQRRFWGTATSAFTTFDVGVTATNTRDHDGTLTDQSVGPFVQYAGPRQSTATATVTRDKSRFLGVTHDLTRANVTFGIKPNGALSLALTGQALDAIDFENGRRGRILSLAPSIEYKIGAPLNLQFSHSFERLTVDQGRLYTANLPQARIVYHFGVRTFVRAILQYTDVRRQPLLYLAPVDAHTRRLFSQYLFSYKLNPQTVVLVGYSDTYQGLSSVAFSQSGRTFFVKVGYAWLL